MHKLLLLFLFLVFFFFSGSEVHAQASTECGTRTDVETTGVVVGNTPSRNCPSGSVCYKTNTSGLSRTFECFKKTGTETGTVPAGRTGSGSLAAPPPAAVPCTDATCTGGKGTRCDLENDGTPIPLTDNRTGPDIGIYTAIGCIPTQPQKLVEGLLRFGTLAAGGVAFIIMLLAALQMITAEGNPESIKAGQEKFYSAIIGLLLIIFSVLLMQVIGVDILGLPDFGPTK